MERDEFLNISPLDHRYSATSPQLFERLSRYLSEAAYIRWQCLVEVALVRVLARRGICPQSVVDEVEAAAGGVTPEEVYREEAVTHHNIRALVNCLRRRVGDQAKPFIHFTATSVDIMDTARAAQYEAAIRDLVLPVLLELEEAWINIAMRERNTVQIGRTHGQQAVPITFGFAIAEYVSRLGPRIELIRQTGSNLRGKMAGAVGAYNASSLFFADPMEFEAEVLKELGLQPATHSTQIVEPEYVADLMHALVSCFGVLANFADDMRHLQRTEIGEVGEAFDAMQVGSSTMPHKRNPWNLEHVKSLWKNFMPHMVTVYSDQISEHQRDLTNSASARFYPEVVAGVVLAADRLLRISRRLVVDRPQMQKNVHMTGDLILAEPLYILLAALGHPDAHERVRLLTLDVEKTGRKIADLLPEQADLAPYLARMTSDQRRILSDPNAYIGIAAQKTEAICQTWSSRLGTTRQS